MARMGVNFCGWPSCIHADFEQVKRIEAGRKLKMNIVSGSAEEPYQCDLESCTCADFAIRHLPCKHIYCLADELGLLADLLKYKKGSSSFNPAAELELERYRSLYKSSQISVDAYVKVCTPLAKWQNKKSPSAANTRRPVLPCGSCII